jgi:hypothetical protein
MKKKLKYDDGGIVSRAGVTPVKRKQGKMTVTEEIPNSILYGMPYDAVDPMVNPLAMQASIPQARPTPVMPHMAPPQDITYDVVKRSDGKPLYLPKFPKDWSSRRISSAWKSIPDMMHGHEVLKGDSWRDVTSVPASTSVPQSLVAKYQDGGFSLNTLPLIQGADTLATQFIYNPQIRASEARMLRNQMMPITSPTNFSGMEGDLVSMASGGLINYPNALVEGGEVMQTPDGVTQNITGEKHSDRPDGMGGTLLNLPTNTKIFSKKTKLDKNVVSDILERKVNKKMSPADIAKKFDTKKYEKVLLDPTSDQLAKRTASIMKEKNEASLNKLFAIQESMKSPNTGIQMGKGGYVRKYALGGSDEDMDLPGPTVHARRLDPLPSMLTPSDLMTMNPYYDTLPSLPLASGIPSGQPDLRMRDVYNPGMEGLGVPAQPQPSGPTPPKRPRLGEYIPEALATINAITDFPVNVTKYQPKYLGEVPNIGIAHQLNRNFSASRDARGSNSGNASIDSARALQAQANLMDANNQIFAQKYNAEAAARYQRDQTNTQIENTASLTNLQRADKFWQDITQRRANRNEALQGVANSVYAKTKNMQFEDESLRVAGEMYPNYKYNSFGDEPFDYIDQGGQVFAVPKGYGSYRSFTPYDNVVSSEKIDDEGNVTRYNRERTLYDPYGGYGVGNRNYRRRR